MTLYTHKGTMRVGTKEQPILLDEIVIKANKMLRFDFDLGRKELFKDGYSQLQVDSINAIVGEANEQGITNKAQLAYVLATVKHETANTMLPIEERGSNAYLSKYDTGKLAKDLGNTPEADGDGQKYKGRGYAQITGLANYKKFAKIMGVDFVKKPELVMEVKNAAFILVYGMVNGTFTGRKLSHYISSAKTDFPNSRRIINGQDKMHLIAGYASQFLKCVI